MAEHRELNLASTSFNVRDEVDHIGSEARFEYAKKLSMLSSAFREQASELMIEVERLRDDAKRAERAAQDLLDGSNNADLFVLIAKFLYEDFES